MLTLLFWDKQLKHCNYHQQKNPQFIVICLELANRKTLTPEILCEVQQRIRSRGGGKPALNIARKGRENAPYFVLKCLGL